jgi:hypothetical protein
MLPLLHCIHQYSTDTAIITLCYCNYPFGIFKILIVVVSREYWWIQCNSGSITRILVNTQGNLLVKLNLWKGQYSCDTTTITLYSPIVVWYYIHSYHYYIVFTNIRVMLPLLHCVIVMYLSTPPVFIGVLDLTVTVLSYPTTCSRVNPMLTPTKQQYI